MPRARSLTSFGERERFASWLAAYVDADPSRSRNGFMRWLGREDASTGLIARYTRSKSPVLPVPDMVRRMAQFWSFSALEAFARCGYWKELLGELAGLARLAQTDVAEANRARDAVLKVAVAAFPLRGEVANFAGRLDDDESRVAWLGHFLRDSNALLDLSRPGGPLPLLLSRASEVLYDERAREAGVDRDAQRFMAGELVRAWLLATFGDDARCFVASAYREGVRPTSRQRR